MKKTACWVCGENKECHYTIAILSKKKEKVGEYCSKECAAADMWGPLFRGARILRLPHGFKGDNHGQ